MSDAIDDLEAKLADCEPLSIADVREIIDKWRVRYGGQRLYIGKSSRKRDVSIINSLNNGTKTYVEMANESGISKQKIGRVIRSLSKKSSYL